jgi:serine/threonine-protein kinase
MGAAGLRRFEREVQLTAGLSHPNTVTVFDYGRTPDGVFYYAMEYLEGLGLDELVAADGPQPPARAVHILRQVLAALAEAHGIGLVHRDVKPGNVILCERGGVSDVAKVVDFGLVKDLEAEGATTHETTLVGTPLYLAPEAIRSPDADARSDLYSVGPWPASSDRPARVRGPDRDRDLRAPLPPPPLRASRTPLPTALEAWVLACLERPGAASPSAAARQRAAQALRPRRRVDPGRGPGLVGGEGPGPRRGPSRGGDAERGDALPAGHRARGLTYPTKVLDRP